MLLSNLRYIPISPVESLILKPIPTVTASEAALALLFQRSELPSFAQEGGILTPMSALGDVFVKRLEASGRFTFNSEVLLEESTKTR